ncbi:glycosyltransferase [Oleidesulfovibrio sp.]|uniref:glycosyltransferase n=1 Tax=Oleidesulfovibrio sp. TaxID=2909707 RepID=UPI003A83CD1D
MKLPIQVIVKYCDPSTGGEGVAYRFCQYLKANDVPFVMVCGRNKDPQGPLSENVVTLGMLRPTRLLKYASFFYRAEQYIAQHKGLPFSFEYVRGAAIVRQTGVHATFLQRSLEGLPEDVRRRKSRSRTWNLYNTYVPLQERRVLSSPALRRILVPSEMTRDEVCESYPEHCSKVAVIHNGVNKQRFAPATLQQRKSARERFWPDAADKRIVGFAGNIFMRKGLAHCIGSLRMLPEDVVLLVAGGDNAEPYLQQARLLNVDRRIRFAGSVSDMPVFFHALDAFCLPTRYDPFGLVIAEAVAAGIPVVASAQAGSAEIIRAGVSGVVCPQLDDAAIAKAIEEALSLPHEGIEETAIDEHDMFAQYLALAESVRG